MSTERRMLNRSMRRRLAKLQKKAQKKPKKLQKNDKNQRDVLLITATVKGFYPSRGYMKDFEPMRKQIIKVLEALYFRHVTVTAMSQKKVGKLKIEPKPKETKKTEKKIHKKSKVKNNA